MEKTLEKNTFCSAMAGIKTLHYVDVKNVVLLSPTATGWAATLADGHDWQRIHFSTATATCVTEEGAYTHQVDTVIPAKGGIAARDMMQLPLGRYLVRVTDHNGTRWLCGDTTSPLRLAVEDTNDGTPNGETAYRLTFSGRTQWPQMPTE